MEYCYNDSEILPIIIFYWARLCHFPLFSNICMPAFHRLIPHTGVYIHAPGLNRKHIFGLVFYYFNDFLTVNLLVSGLHNSAMGLYTFP